MGSLGRTEARRRMVCSEVLHNCGIESEERVGDAVVTAILYYAMMMRGTFDGIFTHCA